MNLAASIRALYETLTEANFPNGARPKLYLTAVPVVDAASTQVNVDTAPYVYFTLLADRTDEGFESDIENLNLTFTAYAIGADKAEQIIQAIRFNGLPRSAVAGFDNCDTLPGFSGFGTFIGCFPNRPPETVQERQPSKESAVVFRCVMPYRVQVERG